MTRSSATVIAVAVLLILVVAPNRAQQPPPGGPDRPLIFDTDTSGPCTGCPPGSNLRIRVVPLAVGLVHPLSIAFLPDGPSMLVTERPGRLRIIREGVLDPQPISGVPLATRQGSATLSERLLFVEVHPQFAQNHLVYLSYPKWGERGNTLAVARGRLDGMTLADVRDIFVADAWASTGDAAYGGKIAFGPDGMLYVMVSDRDTLFATSDSSQRIRAQDLGSHAGKVLRLRDDGSAPPDNPFVGRPGAKPEIYTYGHRNMYGLTFHPETGAPWQAELGALAGDEVNVLLAGRNYGWPLVSLGRHYNGDLVSDQPWWRPGMEMPRVYWMPSLAPSSLMFYTGDRFPAWKGHLLVGGLFGRQLQRVALDQPPLQAERRESLLIQLGARIRDVRQGPDGYVYVATEMQAGGDVPDGAIMRIEPVE